VVFNVPTARSEGIEMELFARPNTTWDFGLSASVIDAKLTSSVTSTLPDGTTVVVGGLQDGNQLPTAPKVQGAAYAGYTLPLPSGRDFFANFTVQYVGSSFSQFENQQPGWGQHLHGLPERGEPVCGAPGRFRRAALRHLVHVQSGAAELHARQPAPGSQDRPLAGRCLHQQPVGRDSAPGARLRAWPHCATRLSDQPAAHFRPVRQLQLLKVRSRGCVPQRISGRLPPGSRPVSLRS